MQAIIALGNPGKNYEKTRHNAGFIILTALTESQHWGSFGLEKKFESEIIEISIRSEKIIIAKPKTFMNRSGEAVKKIMAFYKIPPEGITIIHDDLDIPLGQFKISNDSSAAGHNGVQDIFDNLGTQKIKRLRIGIEGNERKKERVISGSDFVLQNFSEDELRVVKNLTEDIRKALEL